MEKRNEAEKIVKTHVIWAIGAGFVPIPILDIAAVTLIQLDMLKQLCRLYEVDYLESKGKATLSTVTGSTFARIGASAIKAIPGIGTILGSVSMPILSGASTYAIAQAVILHFDSEGDLFNLNIETFKQVYKDHLQKGKEYASKLHKERQTAKASASNSVFKELERLLELKEKGIITEEEFETQKQKLLDRL
jgi:uncharacterized protein (DUF697 family)